MSAPVRPFALRLAIALCLVLAVAALSFGVVEATATKMSRWAVGGGTSIVMLAYGLGFLAVAWGLHRRSRFARGPGVALSLVLLPVAWSFLSGDLVPAPLLAVGVAMAAVNAALVVCLVWPSTTRALFRDRDAAPAAE